MENTLNQDMKNLENYFARNKLSLYVSKSIFMLIGTYQSLAKCEPISVRISNSELDVKCAKYLGMQVDENIKWGLHVDTICRKIACKVGVLKRLIHFATRCHCISIVGMQKR